MSDDPFTPPGQDPDMDSSEHSEGSQSESDDDEAAKSAPESARSEADLVTKKSNGKSKSPAKKARKKKSDDSVLSREKSKKDTKSKDSKKNGAAKRSSDDSDAKSNLSISTSNSSRRKDKKYKSKKHKKDKKAKKRKSSSRSSRKSSSRSSSPSRPLRRPSPVYVRRKALGSGFDQKNPDRNVMALRAAATMQNNEMHQALQAVLAAPPVTGMSMAVGTPLIAGTPVELMPTYPLNPEAELFLTQNSVEPHAAQRLRSLPPEQARQVIRRGSLQGSRDPSAVLISRCRDAVLDARNAMAYSKMAIPMFQQL